MQKEITALAPSSMKVKIVSPPERSELRARNQKWTEANRRILGLDRWFHPRLTLHLPADVDRQVVSGFNRIEGQRLTRSEYDESGPSIVHRKCF